MMGSTESSWHAQERIHIVDSLLAGRVKRAMWKHTWGSPVTRRNGLALLVWVLLAGLALVVHDRLDPVHAAWFLLVSVPAVAGLSYMALVALTMRQVGGFFERQLVPGRMIGVTVGPGSLRVRDHDCAVEYAYPVITGVHQYRDACGDIVVISRGTAVWALPAEMFDVHELHILQTRVGRTGASSSAMSVVPPEATL